MSSLVKEFRPTIYFLLKFLGIYLVGNLLYGLYITAYNPRPDPLTSIITVQSAAVANVIGFDASARPHERKPNVGLLSGERVVVNVYEGCNSLNVMIVFVAFVLGFGPLRKEMWWFIPAGLLIIYLANIARILFLYWITIDFPEQSYFAHKYLFTAFIYLIVFGLWVWWVVAILKLRKHAA